MALTRKFLSALGIEPEKIDEIINAHTETTDGLKEELARVKADADKLPDVQKELDAMKKAAEELDGKNPFEVKYTALKEEFEAYKADQTAKAEKAQKTTAFRDLLKSIGVSEKRIDAVLRVSDVDGVKLDADGKIVESEKLSETLKTEWADFITKEAVEGAKESTPPANNQGGADYDNMSDADYYKATYEAGKVK